MVTWTGLAVVMSAYMINATTSCGPSPLGGAGMMAEGTLRAETGYLKGAFSFVAMAMLAPLAALFMKFMNLQVFDTGFGADLGLLIAGVLFIVVVNWALIKLVNVSIGSKLKRGWNVQLIVFLVAGAVAGAMLSYALYDFEWVGMLQGALGGLGAAVLIGLMTPRARNVRKPARVKA